MQIKQTAVPSFAPHSDSLEGSECRPVLHARLAENHELLEQFLSDCLAVLKEALHAKKPLSGAGPGSRHLPRRPEAVKQQVLRNKANSRLHGRNVHKARAGRTSAQEKATFLRNKPKSALHALTARLCGKKPARV